MIFLNVKALCIGLIQIRNFIKKIFKRKSKALCVILYNKNSPKCFTLFGAEHFT